MSVREADLDQLLHIQTTDLGERQDQDAEYNQHEVTPYWMLAALFEAYPLKNTDSFVDFGSGLGRIIFYVHDRFRVAVTGIEMNDELHRKAMTNKLTYVDNQKKEVHSDLIQLKHGLAEDYEVKVSQNRFYFFNPFSTRIFKQVVTNILNSFAQHRREIDMIFYYPDEQYIHYLETNTPFTQVQEVKIPGLYEINHHERFLIFRLEA